MHSLAPATLVVALMTIGTLVASALEPDPDPVGGRKEEAAVPAVDLEKAKGDPKLAHRAALDLKASKGNLGRIGIAVHEYHDARGRLPADSADKKGKALLSWRVALLPYLGQDKLFKEFKQEEAWDSSHNLRLLKKMPDVYRSPRVKLKEGGNTVYQVFTGPNAAFGRVNPLTLAGVPDGTSNTILAIESATATPWTKPGGIPFDRKKALPDFRKAYGNRPLGVMLDGSPRLLLLDTIKAETLKNAIDPADGNVLGQDWKDGTEG